MALAQTLNQWVIGALFSLVLLMAGWLFAGQASAMTNTRDVQNKHAERIAKLETMMESQVKANERLASLFQEWLDYDRQRERASREGRPDQP